MNKSENQGRTLKFLKRVDASTYSVSTAQALQIEIDGERWVIEVYKPED